MSNDDVIDASALILALVGKDSSADLLRARLPAMHRHAPHLIDAEVGNVLRRHERAGLVSTAEAHAALQASRALVEHRYEHAGPLAELAWTWRANVTFYDAHSIALAGQLGAPLLTADARLRKVPGPSCEVEVV